jgi:hypothetical protein
MHSENNQGEPPMTNTNEGATALNPVLATPGTKHTFALYAITLPSFLLAGLCFGWHGSTGEIALLLLGLVTFGMAYDFCSHILGLYFSRYKTFLRWYSRINYWALCFGIPFTAFAGTFVMAEVAPDSISAKLAEHYLAILYISVAFGSLFLFARYREQDINGAVEYVLDKKDPYTKFIFIARRTLLALSLVIGVIVMIDGLNTEWMLWAMAFGLSFIVTVPLHIMHKQIPSMASELTTQVIAAYGSWVVFVA